MTTLKDVAREVGVSVATVSYVLTGKGSVSKEVSDQVRRAAKKLNYRPSRIAQSMRTGMTQSIGFMLPDLTNPCYPELAQKVESAARSQGVSVILVDSQDDVAAQEEGLSLFQQHAVDGIILCPAEQTPHKSLSKPGCPVVLIDRPLPGFDVVYSDYLSAGALLADYAIALGHQKVGMLSGPQALPGARQRRDGILKAAGDRLTVVWDEEVPISTEPGGRARKALCSRAASLVFAADDLIAIDAIAELDACGLQVPQDVSVLGFGNIPWSKLVKPKITTINRPVSAIAAAAVDVLFERIRNPGQPVRTVVLEVDLVERDSAIRYSG